MGPGTLSLGAATALGLSAFLLRRRISRKWIDVAKTEKDLSGKVIIITGGNVGLGLEAALDFARRNAKVVLGCRNVQKGQDAIKTIQEKTGNVAGECIELDLAKMASVRKFADEVKAKYPEVYALVLNAGVWVPMEEKQKTKDGFEIHFGVNHLAHFELANSLGAYLARSGDSRIIFVASSLLKNGKLDFAKEDFVREGRVGEEVGEDGKKKHAFAPTGYCDSKLMNALTCKHLTTMLPKEVTTYALCPGFCRSSLGRNVEFPFYKKLLIAPVFLIIQRTTAQGAQNIIFTVITDKDELQSGAMYSDGEVSSELQEYVESLGEDAPKKLWEISEKAAASVR